MVVMDRPVGGGDGWRWAGVVGWGLRCLTRQRRAVGGAGAGMYPPLQFALMNRIQLHVDAARRLTLVGARTA